MFLAGRPYLGPGDDRLTGGTIAEHAARIHVGSVRERRPTEPRSATGRHAVLAVLRASRARSAASWTLPQGPPAVCRSARDGNPGERSRRAPTAPCSATTGDAPSPSW